MSSAGAADLVLLNYTYFDMIQAKIQLSYFDICLKLKIIIGKQVHKTVRGSTQGTPFFVVRPST